MLCVVFLFILLNALVNLKKIQGEEEIRHDWKGVIVFFWHQKHLAYAVKKLQMIILTMVIAITYNKNTDAQKGDKNIVNYQSLVCGL